MLSNELGLAPSTIKRTLLQQGVEPGQDGKYSLKQVFEGWMKQFKGSDTKARIEEEQLEKLMLDNQERRGELVSRSKIFKELEPMVTGIRQTIEACPSLGANERKAILKQISSYGSDLRQP